MKRSYVGLLPYILAITFILGIVLSNSTAQAQSGGGYRFVTQWGSETGNGQLHSPCAVAVDALGNVYIADLNNFSIQKFSSSGVFITKWGTKGTGDGQFFYPGGIAIDASGNVYVADVNNHRIQKFSSEGVFITKWGSYGYSIGYLAWPHAVAVDASGNVYVANWGNRRIDKFSSTGVSIGCWGSQGKGDGQFTSPDGIAVDASGDVYVVDSDNHRVQKFSSSGSFIAKWDSLGSGDGEFFVPSGIAVDTSGNVYVDDSGNHRIQKFSASGSFLTKWGSEGSEDGQFYYFHGPHSLAIDASGYVYVVDSCNHRIQKFSSSGSFITKWGTECSGDGQFYDPRGVAVDVLGNVYVADSGNHRIQKFSSSGSFIATWGSEGIGEGQFNDPCGVAVDASGNVYVADRSNHRIQKFSFSGSFISQWGSLGSGDGQFASPNSVAVDTSGNVYVADPENRRIQKFDSKGQFVTKWSSSDGQRFYPIGITVDASGDIYIAERTYSRVMKFSPEGVFMTQWGPSGSFSGQFQRVLGVSVDASGSVYVVEGSDTNYIERIESSHVYKFSSSGSLLTKWGSWGSDNGQFLSPSGVAVDSTGNVYVVDSDNWIVQKFAPVPSAGANTNLYFPHVVSDASWQTEIALINTGDQITAGMMRAFSDEGRLIETKDVVLSAHGRRQIDVAAEFAEHTDIGYIIFKTYSVYLLGYAKFYREGVYWAAVPAVKEFNTSDIFIPHIASDARWWTRLCLLNTTPESKEWTILFNDGQTRNIMLNAHEHRSFDIASLFDNQPQPDIQSAVIFNANGIIGLEIFGSTDGNRLEAIPLTDKMTSTLYYPHVAGDGWWTGVVAYNPSDLACTMTVTPYTLNGSPLGSSTLPIAGKGKYVGAVSSLGLPAETSWFRIDSTRPLSGFELFGTDNDNQLGSCAGGVNAGLKEGVFPKIEKDGWTDIVLVNTEARSAYVTLTAYDDNGTPVDGRTIIIRGHAKVVKPVEELFLHDISGATYIIYLSDRNIVGFQLNGCAEGAMLDGLPALVGAD